MRRRPWLDTVIPERVANIPAFLTREERQYLIWITENRYEGWGAIADLGAWLGGSSACMAEGLKRKGRSTKIQAFDLFHWEPQLMGPYYWEETLAEGADFMPVLEKQVREHRAWIQPRKADLMTFRWNEGPIEILFVDAAKTWDLTNAIFAGFGDSLVPGKTLVVFQDFRFGLTHWLPLIVGSRPDLWEEVDDVGDGTTVTFRVLAPLRGAGGLRADYSDESFSLAESEKIIRARMERESPANRALLLQAIYRKALIELPSERVRAVREELFATGRPEPAVLAALEDVAWTVSKKAWLAHGSGDVALARRLAEECVEARGAVPHCLHLLGRICLDSGELPLGDAYLTRAIEAGGASSTFASLDRAELRRRLGRFEEAERDALVALTQAAGAEPATTQAVRMLERIWLNQGQLGRGVTVLGDLARKSSGSALLWAQLARLENLHGQRTQSMEHIAHATSLAPADPFVLWARGELGLGASSKPA